MTDIAKCAGFKEDEHFRHWCPLRETCFRYTAKDAGASQSWMQWTWKVDEFKNVSCEGYLLPSFDFARRGKRARK